MEIPYLPGKAVVGPSPLARFLPPLEEGTVALAIERFGMGGQLVLDPFGASPRLALEAAQQGCSVLVAVNNPITRYVLRHTLQPFALDELQSALSRLAALAKDGGRLEPFLLDLYQTVCSRCGRQVSVEYFVWDREENVPVLKFYACPYCNHSIEEPTDAEDRRRSLEHGAKGLQHATALEQLAPRGSPDRVHAEAAVSVYPGRAIYAIMTLLNKLRQHELGDRMEAARALLLVMLDQTNALWGYPEGRIRPLQLTASPRYLESNAWRALEQAIGQWSGSEFRVELVEWDGEASLRPGRVTLFEGPVRELSKGLPVGRVERILTVIPRPNQAYWTLSALWAAWLWGREAADPVRAALRRRRYDWAWHADALQTTLRAMRPALSDKIQVVGLMPDAEPGFLAAALAGFDGAGFRLTGRALRSAEGQAILTWESEGGPGQLAAPAQLAQIMKQAAQHALTERGEPSSYELPHEAAWSELATRRLLARAQGSESRTPLGTIGEDFDQVLADRSVFEHLGKGAEPETGRYWLSDPAGVSLPLADRVEGLALGILREQDRISALELDRRLCEALPGLLTPDRRLVMTVLRSYAVPEGGGGLWSLRSEDRGEARQADRLEIQTLLAGLGNRLGFEVEGGDPIRWADRTNEQLFSFWVDETARLGTAMRRQLEQSEPGRSSGLEVVVMPGGRAALVAEKSRRDPQLQSWLESAPRVMKFRHVRRLAEDTTLERGNLLDRLVLDPPGHEDPQLPLL
ncbi:MAG: hypothetical protein ACRDHG_03910 [Anaerolineales bacterium]